MGKRADSLLPFVSKPVLPEPPSPPGSAGDVQGDSSVSVYVRVRPLLEDETKSGVGLMPGMVTSTSDPDNTSATAGDYILLGFLIVFQPVVFTKDILPHLFLTKMLP